VFCEHRPGRPRKKQRPAPEPGVTGILEFLGEWQTSKGELIDPLQLQDVDTSDSNPKVNKGDQHD
jgi:hypothetical protein